MQHVRFTALRSAGGRALTNWENVLPFHVLLYMPLYMKLQLESDEGARRLGQSVPAFKHSDHLT